MSKSWYDDLIKRRSQQPPESIYVDEAPVNPKDLKIKRAGIAFVTGGSSGGRGDFEDPPIDFEEIQRAYENDSLIRQALDKYIYLIFKEGYRITSANTAASDYIKARLRLMGLATGISTNELFIEMASTLVKNANVFVIKSRQDYKVPISGLRIQGIQQKPVAGYFVQNTATVKIARNVNGEPARYRVEVDGNTPKEFKPEDVIHMYYDKEPGRAFAVPWVWEVLDDVKLLRQLEDTVAKMVYKETFPLRVATVGGTEEGKEASDEEIQDVTHTIENMPEDGFAVVPAHVKFDVLGGQGEALQAQNYLSYFRDRVFAGLGVSKVMMGQGEGASRSTADNIVDQMFDRIEGLQAVIADNITQKMFFELLQEGGFDPLNNPDDNVVFAFNPVDMNRMIKRELHEMAKFQGNMISIDEARANAKMDPVTDDLSRFFSNLFKIPEMQAQAQAQAAVAAASAGASGQGSTASTSNKVQPANQHGKKSAPTRAKNANEAVFEKLPPIRNFNEYFERQFEFVREDLVQIARQFYQDRDKRAPEEEVPGEMGLMLTLASDNVNSRARSALLGCIVKGADDARQATTPYQIPSIPYDEALIRTHMVFGECVNRLMNDVKQQSTVVFHEASTASDAISRLNSVMDSLKYRIAFIVRTEMSRAYNYGFAMFGAKIGKTAVKVKADCPTCAATYPNPIPLEGNYFALIPPASHPNCSCELEFL